ncbi:hypothetical protein SNEBB_002434 [Seison nebaliae]|nr:hypothetical protein SNEBB_002434 [Seison nebaliae]
MFVRKSRFRHVFGQPYKRQDCYDDIRITRTSFESTYCSVNSKFVAVIIDACGGGCFLVLPLEKTGRVDRDTPFVSGHRAAVLEITWSPHNDNIIASSSDDTTVKVWEIPDGGLTTNMNVPIRDLKRHERKVGILKWHPSAYLVLLSAGMDGRICFWNVEQEELLSEIMMPDLNIISVAWSFDGSQIATTSKDRKIRLIEPRSGKILKETNGHSGTKPQHVIILRDGKVFTTGFSRLSDRQYALWDENLKQVDMVEIDSSNGTLFPFYDPDVDIIYLVGKGDAMIKYFEYTPDTSPYIHYLNHFGATDSQRGMGYMPKRCLDFAHCEVARFFKLHNSGFVEVISFTVPRKSELFQEDIYPDTPSIQPAITADEWFNGKDSIPTLVPVKSLMKSDSSITTKSEVAQPRRKIKPIGGDAPNSVSSVTTLSSSASETRNVEQSNANIATNGHQQHHQQQHNFHLNNNNNNSNNDTSESDQSQQDDLTTQSNDSLTIRIQTLDDKLSQALNEIDKLKNRIHQLEMNK